LAFADYNCWYKRKYANNLVLNGLASLQQAYFSFFKTKNDQSTTAYPSRAPGSAASTSSISKFDYNKESDVETDAEESNVGTDYNIAFHLKQEIEKFAPLFDVQSKAFKHYKSNSTFWIDFKEKATLLNRLYMVLSNIPAGSSFIERFFSICGIVNKQRASNMTLGLFRARCLLKTNIKLLDALSTSTNIKNTIKAEGNKLQK
jgi:hypothetical protein